MAALAEKQMNGNARSAPPSQSSSRETHELTTHPPWWERRRTPVVQHVLSTFSSHGDPAMFTTSTRPGAQYRDSREWGPAKHDPEHPFHLAQLDAPVAGTDLRDGDAGLPDDN